MTTKGNRQALPDNPLRCCSACLAVRGNVRKGWEPITRAGQVVVGWTCPACPTVSEPIRRVESNGRVRFRVVVDATPPGSRQRRQVTRTLTTLDEARDFVASVRAEVERAGAFEETTEETVRALCERWLVKRAEAVRDVTIESYRFALLSALRRIGDRLVVSITVDDVEDLRDWLRHEGGRRGQGLGPTTVRATLIALAQAFDLAVRDKTVTSNVVRLAPKPRRRNPTSGRDLQHWQPADLIAFRRYADSDPLAAAWRLTLSGLTRADVMGLRWADVDLVAGVVSITQGRVAFDHADVTDDPKSKQRERSVPVESIHPGTVALLRTMRATQAAERLVAGPAYVESGLVVVDALGQPIRPEHYSERFRRLCSAADVPVIRLHSVRHSLAFWLHQIGVAPADAAALLGHTVEIHLSTYLPHSGAAGITAAAAALGRAAAAEG